MSERDSGSDKPFQFTDRRRFDPATGTRRPENPAAAGASGHGPGVSVGGPAAPGTPFGGPAAPGTPAADPADPENATQPLNVDLISTELEQARQEAAERTADLQRVSAEYANYRKRVDRDREQVAAGARSSVVADLLAVLDDVDRAQAHGDLVGAFKATADKLSGVLDKLGLQRVGEPGDAFDPARHEAVQFATSTEVTAPTVTEVLRVGYTISDRLVRPAVVVVTGPEHETAAAPADVVTPDES